MPKKEDAPRSSRRSAAEATSSSSRKSQGWGAVVKRQDDIAKAKESAEKDVREFWLKGGESAQIQFLQDEPYCYDAHTVKDKHGKWTTVPCQLNTKKHCLLCTEGSKQTWKAAFMILDYRGTWNKEKSKFNKDEKIVKIWKVGATIANQLKQQIDKRGKDLTKMVFEVSRSGDGKDSTYNFEPAFDEDDDDVKLVPVKFKEGFPEAEELCQPFTEDEMDDMGLVVVK